MNKLPFEQKEIDEAEKLLQGKKVQFPLFSEGTYQVEVFTEKKGASCWPFLQLSDEGALLDSFCTCSTAEKLGSCKHIAAAYYKIYDKKPYPLHIRFRESLWNRICFLASRRHGFSSDIFVRTEKGYQIVSVTGKLLFTLQGITDEGKKRMEEILFQRAPETEETSLKFSNLPSEEIALWRQGRPSHQLEYELSFWSDLAKWWMFLQEERRSYKIEFLSKEGQLPYWLQIHCADVEIGFYVAKANWPSLIPSLSTVVSPLKIYEFPQRQVEKIHYDKEKRSFFVEYEKKEEGESLEKHLEHGIEMEGWIYVAGSGFFPSKAEDLFKGDVIHKERVSALLQKYPHFVRKYLTGEKIHEGKYKPKYHLFFDDRHFLHVQTFLFEMGDLTKEKSAFFGSWVYVDSLGFFQLEDPLFASEEETIPVEQVGDFVNRHRSWLNQFEGFQTHITALEADLTYVFDPEKGLSFQSHLDFWEDKNELIDCMDWLYIRSKGFFPKPREKLSPALYAGQRIPKKEISSFIRQHQQDLVLLSSFFASHSPVERIELDIFITEENRICVRPFYNIKISYSKARIFFLGEYTYIEKEGFAEIPYERVLLDDYLEETLIEKKEENAFLSHTLEVLQPYIRSLDKRLTVPKELHLTICDLKKEEKAKVGKWVVDLGYETNLGKVDVIEVWQAIKNNQKYLFSDAGLISLKLARFNWLKGLSKKRFLLKGKKIRLSSLEWMRLFVFEDIRENLSGATREKKARALFQEFRNFEVGKPIDLDGLNSQLRSYQETGVKWLWFLYTNGLSGLLCDDMGLGKTHQAMALIAAAFNASGRTGKYLVVCPTSVMYHWQALFARFFPAVRVNMFYGYGRQLSDFAESYDILLTSYGTLRSEKDLVSKIVFDIAIFDEIQNAKNHHSLTNKSLRAMKSGVKVGLTGTPIENRIMELKALFDVVLPTYLPSDAQFKELFVNPIEKNQDEEKKALLSRVIKPFILRRKKAEVLLELPEKIEEISLKILAVPILCYAVDSNRL